jgi:hypothetical protein
MADARRRIPTQYILNLAWINKYSSLRDDMTLEGDLLHPKLTLAQFGIQPMISKLLQNQMEMFFMFFLTP